MKKLKISLLISFGLLCSVTNVFSEDVDINSEDPKLDSDMMTVKSCKSKVLRNLSVCNCLRASNLVAGSAQVCNNVHISGNLTVEGRDNISEAQGPVGDQGPAGPAGADNTIAGATGLVGPTGAQGLIGDQGPVGATGEQGDVGPTGLVGITGAQGPIGDQGSVGATGEQGDVGPTGAVGATGDQGPIGATGVDIALEAIYRYENVPQNVNDGQALGFDTAALSFGDMSYIATGTFQLDNPGYYEVWCLAYANTLRNYQMYLNGVALSDGAFTEYTSKRIIFEVDTTPSYLYVLKVGGGFEQIEQTSITIKRITD